jgi:hypothetical protein
VLEQQRDPRRQIRTNAGRGDHEDVGRDAGEREDRVMDERDAAVRLAELVAAEP